MLVVIDVEPHWTDSKFYAAGDIRYNPDANGNKYEERCACTEYNDRWHYCVDCHHTGWKPVLVSCNDKWWIRLLRRIVK